MAGRTHAESSSTGASPRRRNDALSECLNQHTERIRFLVDVRMNAELSGRVSAEDLAQDVFVEAMTQSETFEYQNEAGFCRWIATVVRRVVCRAARALNRTTQTLSIRNDGNTEREVHPSHIPGQTRTPSSIVGREERCRQVRKELASLPEKDHAVIRIVRLEDRSLKEAAAEMHCSPDTARKRLSRAMLRFRAQFAHWSRDR